MKRSNKLVDLILKDKVMSKYIPVKMLKEQGITSFRQEPRYEDYLVQRLNFVEPYSIYCRDSLRVIGDLDTCWLVDYMENRVLSVQTLGRRCSFSLLHGEDDYWSLGYVLSCDGFVSYMFMSVKGEFARAVCPVIVYEGCDIDTEILKEYLNGAVSGDVSYRVINEAVKGVDYYTGDDIFVSLEHNYMYAKHKHYVLNPDSKEVFLYKSSGIDKFGGCRVERFSDDFLYVPSLKLFLPTNGGVWNVCC